MKRGRFSDLGSTSSDSSEPSDNEREEKRPRVISENLSPTWTTVKATEVNEKRKQVNDLGKSIYTAICSLNYENFKENMESKDPEFIDDLTKSIEVFIDQLVMVMYDTDRTNWTDIPLIQQVDCANLVHHCHKDTMKCPRSIPGYYATSKKQHGDPRKAFIPQMYKILQDYGFFHRYLGYNMIDAYVTIKDLNSTDWALQIGVKIGEINDENQEIRVRKRIQHINDMKTRIRRVQFLRAFDVRCCLEKEPDSGHKQFDSVLQEVYNALERYRIW